MITFTDRENSLRIYLAGLKEKGETDSSLAKQFGLAVRTIREFWVISINKAIKNKENYPLTTTTNCK